MARPKEKLSEAFRQKCLAAADKVRKVQADKLKDDMLRLCEDDIHSDMEIRMHDRDLPVNKFVLKSRSIELYEKLMSFPHSGDNPCMISLPGSMDFTKLEDLMRSLYTDNDVSAAISTLLRCLRDLEDDIGSSDSHRLLTEMSDGADYGQRSCEFNCSFVENTRTTISSFPDEVSTSSITSELQGDAFHSRLTGDGSVENTATLPISSLDASHGKSSHESIREMAEKIVCEAIQKALCFVSERENGAMTEDLLDFDEKTFENKNDHQGQRLNNNETQSSYDEVSDKHLLANKSNESPTPEKFNTIDNKQKPDNDIETVKKLDCKPVFELIQQVYSLETVFTPCSLLGEDLLRMLLQEVDCDCAFKVGSEELRAHKCVLSARSSYFDAMLGGAWLEGGDGAIVLQGIDAGTMKHCLLYLYGGVVEMDTRCNIGALVMMADMYSMAGLNDVIAFNLNKDYCHFFHRPCAVCTSGVPETLALTMMYNMDVLKEKCLKWVNKNFEKVWPTKAFATLPPEVLEYCSQAAVKDLANDNVIDTLLECRKLNEKCPKLRWTEPVFDMITQLMDSAIEYASQNFTHIVCSNTFRKIDQQDIAFNRQPLEDIFGLVIASLSPENSCQSYLALNKWIMTFKAREDEREPLYTEEFVQLVEALHERCKDHMCIYIHQVANTVEWTLLNKDMQKGIMEAANFVCLDSPGRNRVARPMLTSMQKKITSTYPLSLKEYFDRHFGLADVPSQPAETKGKPVARQSKLKKGIPTQKTVPKVVEKTQNLEKSKTLDKKHTTQAKSGSSAQKRLSDGTGTDGTKTSKQTSQPTSLPRLKEKNKQSQQIKLNKSLRSVDHKNRRQIINHEKADQLKENSALEQNVEGDDTQKDAENCCQATVESHDYIHNKNINELLCGTNLGGASINQNRDLLLDASNIEKCYANDHIPPTNENDNAVGGAYANQNRDFLLDNSNSADQSSPRRHVQSASSATFQSHNAPMLTSVRSVDSIFSSREGQRSTVDKLVPTLKVNFIIPHEFYEAF